MTKKIILEYREQGTYYDCQLADIRKHFVVGKPDLLLPLTIGKKIVVFDEAQTIQDIGTILKIFHDTYPETQIVATGSSSFSLAAQVGEPLVGRMFKYILYPLSMKEIFDHRESNLSDEELNSLLVYGSYPEIITGKAESKIEYLTLLSSNFLYKDLAGFEEIRKPELLRNLVELLAYQIGNEVSYHELATKLGVRRETILRYIYMLEEAFIIFRLYPFSRNLRSEIGKKHKIYFYDLGVRNAVINKFSPTNARDDVGALWENFCIMERKKQTQEKNWHRGTYFWRTTSQKEIDYIEEYNGSLYAYEFKWGGREYKIPKEFMNAYPGSSAVIVNKYNYLEWLS